jgi:hypothetical protein
MWTIIPKPETIIKPHDNQKMRDREKPMSPVPKIIAATTRTVSKPSMLSREARYIAPIRAPIPAAPIRKPSVWAPPCRTS